MTVLLPQRTSSQIGLAGAPRRRAARALPAARAQRRPHHLAAPHLDRALCRAARARRGDAAGAPQLLHRRGARQPLLDLPQPRSCRRWCHGSSGSPTDREDTFVAGPVDGRLRRAEVGAAPSPGRFAAAASLSGAARRRPARRTPDPPAGPALCATDLRRRATFRQRRRPFSLLDRPARGRPSRRSTWLRHRGPPVRRQPALRRRAAPARAARSPTTSRPAPTTGRTGTRRSRTCWPGCRCAAGRTPAEHGRGGQGRSPRRRDVGPGRWGQAPTVPSTPSRRKSAWPLCRAYSWMRCSITSRSDTSSPHRAL